MTQFSLRDVIEAWERVSRGGGAMGEQERLDLARAALDLGHPTFACEILSDALRRGQSTAELHYLAALAHARIGAYSQAGKWVDTLIENPGDAALGVQALSLAGRIAKDRWARLPPGDERAQACVTAIKHYRDAWNATRDPFPGVNAATLLVLSGDPAAGRALAEQVRVAALAADSSLEPHWREATLGEVALLLGELESAATHYAAAVAAAGRNVGHVASMRRQLRLLGRSMQIPEAVFAALSVPSVAAFTGHMIDAPNAPEPRFPAHIEAAVAKRIAQTLQQHGVGFGYCSAACGADLLFIEAMLARGAEVHVTLPFDRADFVATSVAFAGPGWVQRFDAALERVASVSFGVRERFLGDEALFPYAAALINGAAILRARELESEPLMLAVMDTEARDLAGGTRATLESWTRHGLRAERIDLTEIRLATPSVGRARKVPLVTAVEVRSTPPRREVRTMLFADVVGFSKLAEEDTPAFVLNFFGAIAEIVRHSERKPAFVNTWGDGLFMVFNDVDDGATFALQLCDAVRRTDWPAYGLPEGTSIRIGMHTGPVFPALDPLIKRLNYFGSHVNRAARIEPVAAPGSVYASSELAFVLAASGSAHFVTDYLGLLPLAKGFGSSSLYRLRRADEAE